VIKSGLRSRRPGPAILDPLMQEIEGALAEDLPLKDADGNVPAPDRFMVELAAIALLRVRLPLRHPLRLDPAPEPPGSSRKSRSSN
jgi:hypothetical protein